MALRKLNEGEHMLFLDISGSGGVRPDWAHVGLSRVFRLDYGAIAVTRDYIRFDAPVTMVAGCQPRLDGELSLYEGDPAYDFVSALFLSLPAGREAVVPALMLFGGDARRAWRCDGCTLVPRVLDAVGGRVTFTLALSGAIERGHWHLEGGTPAFVEA